jgi:hypothetical protein
MRLIDLAVETATLNEAAFGSDRKPRGSKVRLLCAVASYCAEMACLNEPSQAAE